MKKILIIIITIGISLVIGDYFTRCSPLDTKECAFCNPVVLETQVCYEDEYIRVLPSHKPAMPGHILIIPKRHIVRFEDLNQQECNHITQAIKNVDVAIRNIHQTSAYLLLQKNGYECGQEVPHVHFHYIPRKEHDASILKLLYNMISSIFHSPLSSEKMQELKISYTEALNRSNCELTSQCTH